MRCTLWLGAGVLIAGLAIPSLLIAQEPGPDRAPPRPPREAPPNVDRPQTRDPGPVEKPVRERPTRRDPDARSDDGQQRNAQARARKPAPDPAPVETGPARMTTTPEPRTTVRPPDEAMGPATATARWRGVWRPDTVNVPRRYFLYRTGLLCHATAYAPSYAVAYWTGEGSPLLLGDKFALMEPGRARVERTAFGYPGASSQDGLYCEPDPAAATAAVLGAAARTCAVVSARTTDGEEQSVAVDLPKLGAFGPVVLRQKIVERLQAGEKVVLTGRHQRTLRIDAGVAELNTRTCREGDL